MSTYITGDIHGDPTRFSTTSFPEQKKFKDQEHNYVIICGDFGLVWDWHGESERERYWLDWLENKNFTTLFIDGNHECHTRLDELPVEQWHGGKVSFVRPHVIHLKRGQIFDIEGKTFFAFGGASSHDIQDGVLEPNDPRIKQWTYDYSKMFRINNRSWWKRELPSKEEMNEGWENLKNHDFKVDFIVTHSPCSSMMYYMGHGNYKTDYLSDYLDEIHGQVEYSQWYFGHMHVDANYYAERMAGIYYDIDRVINKDERDYAVEAKRNKSPESKEDYVDHLVK